MPGPILVVTGKSCVGLRSLAEGIDEPTVRMTPEQKSSGTVSLVSRAFDSLD